MLKHAIVLVGLFGLGFLCLALAEETKLSGNLIPLTGKTRGSSTGFFFGASSVTWWAAREACLQSGLTLLVLENSLKQSMFEQYLDASVHKELGNWSGYAWIGGKDTRSETGGVGPKRFYWEPFTPLYKTNMTYWNFATGPDCDPGPGCVAISNVDTAASFGKWYAQSCEVETMYFCESKG